MAPPLPPSCLTMEHRPRINRRLHLTSLAILMPAAPVPLLNTGSIVMEVPGPPGACASPEAVLHVTLKQVNSGGT
ncbi:MAG: hypothetical protein NVS4B8_02410 [Herpetosiphon sp.]